ncbi:hypothetical protein RRF57_009879 [Xylaria bambusicola]|uniref:Uncharacterized protein n=1 Tax=Xylaria bambusicola TaxID=326684 RepID=A0AAN7UKC7_9PEZI
MQRLIAERDGLEYEPDDPVLMELFYKAGSASYTSERPTGISDVEYFKLIHSLAPIESDGPEDKDEWDLIKEYSSLGFDDPDGLNQTDSLSSMLEAWNFDKVRIFSVAYFPVRVIVD